MKTAFGTLMMAAGGVLIFAAHNVFWPEQIMVGTLVDVAGVALTGFGFSLILDTLESE